MHLLLLLLLRYAPHLLLVVLVVVLLLLHLYLHLLHPAAHRTAWCPATIHDAVQNVPVVRVRRPPPSRKRNWGSLRASCTTSKRHAVLRDVVRHLLYPVRLIGVSGSNAVIARSCFLGQLRPCRAQARERGPERKAAMICTTARPILSKILSDLIILLVTRSSC